MIALYLTAFCVTLDRRNQRTWEDMAASYQPEPGRYVAFRNAGTLLGMVDYACLAERHLDNSLAETIRREAMKNRIAALLGSAPLA
jgi:hypothetical protein